MPVKRTMLALLGQTPQIITEALFALHSEGRFPQRVVVLTTQAGREACLKRLLDEGKLQRLLAATGRGNSGAMLRPEDVLVPRDALGEPLGDIVTSQDSDAFFELCFHTVRTLTADEGTEILFSVAGGRKTMSVALALAAQCYARSFDSMFHVLVPARLEKDREFFFPEGKQVGEPVWLTPIPFFRLRETLPRAFFRQTPNFASLLELCRPEQPLVMHVDFRARTLVCQGKRLVLPPALFAVYAFFARHSFFCAQQMGEAWRAQCARGKAGLTWEEIAARRGEITELYARIENRALARGQRGILNLSPENFRSYISRLRKAICLAFGEETGKKLCICSARSEGKVRYGLALAGEQFVLEQDFCMD